jgi:hypothetical protein
MEQWNMARFQDVVNARMDHQLNQQGTPEELQSVMDAMVSGISSEVQNLQGSVTTIQQPILQEGRLLSSLEITFDGTTQLPAETVYISLGKNADASYTLFVNRSADNIHTPQEGIDAFFEALIPKPMQ